MILQTLLLRRCGGRWERRARLINYCAAQGYGEAEVDEMLHDMHAQTRAMDGHLCVRIPRTVGSGQPEGRSS